MAEAQPRVTASGMRAASAYGVMIGASIPGEHHRHGSLRGISRAERFGRWTMADFLFLALNLFDVPLLAVVASNGKKK